MDMVTRESKTVKMTRGGYTESELLMGHSGVETASRINLVQTICSKAF